MNDDNIYVEENFQNNGCVNMPKPEKIYSVPEIIFAFFSLAFGYLFIKIGLAGFLSAGATLFFIIFIVSASVIVKKSGIIQSSKSRLLMILSVVSSLYFTVSANILLKVFNLMFVIILLTLWSFSLNNNGYKGADDSFAFTMLKSLFGEPFKSYGECYSASTSAFKKNQKGKNVKYIIIGLIIAIPVTFIAGSLLVSADGFFSDMMDKMFSNIGEKAFTNIIQFAFGISLGFYIFGMIFSSIRNKNENKLDIEYCAFKRNTLKVFHPIIIYSSVIPLCLIYVMFFFSQINYFVSAFMGTLPSEYSFSEYARRGFFELFFVAILNLGVIACINLFCKNSDNDANSRPKALKFFTVLLSVFTLILISTALSKMIMYIQRYGLTNLRVYTTWFMILIVFIFALIIIRQFKKINIAKIGSIAFTVMFLVLCFSNVDSLIVQYNYNAYQNGYLNEFDTSIFYELSDDAVYEILSLTQNSNKKISNDAKDYFKEKSYWGVFNENDMRTFNIASYVRFLNSNKKENIRS